MPEDPCDTYHIACLPHEYCVVNRTTNRGMCVPYPYCKEAHCQDDQQCEVISSGCGPNDNYCHMYGLCKNAPYGKIIDYSLH